MLSVYVFSNLIHNYALLGSSLIMMIFLMVLGCAGEVFFMRRGKEWQMLAVPAALVLLSEAVYLFYKGYLMVFVLGFLHYIWALLIGAVIGWVLGKTVFRGK